MQASNQPFNHDTIVETIRKAVKEWGRILPPTGLHLKKEGASRLFYTIKCRDIKPARMNLPGLQ
jgi:hypothetical protein